MTTNLEELIEQGEKVLQDISSKFLLIEGKPLILPPAPNQQFFDQYGEKEITKDKKKKILMKQQLDYDAECLVYHQFERLDEEIIVLHNLAYSSKQIEFPDGKSVDGQHDFVVLVPGKAVIVLEVKNPLLKESENPFNTLKHAKKSATDQIKAFRCLLGELYAKTKEAPLEILGFPAFPKLDPSKLDPSKEIPSLKCNEFFSQQDLANFPLWWQKNVADRIGSENRPKKMRHMPETVHSLDKCQKILMGLWLTNFNLQASKPKNCFPIMLDRNEIMACTIRYIDSLLISQTIFSDLQKKSDILVKVEKTDKEYLSKAQCLKHIKYFTRDQVKLLETQSRILVNGPAGSGKTIIMYARILKLLAKTKAKDEKVLVLVPWNDAAKELKKIISNSTQPPKVIDLVKKLHETDCEPDLFFNILKGIEKHKVVIFSKPNFLLNSKLNKKYGHAKLREAHELFIDVLERETGVGKTCLLNQLCNNEFIIPPLTVGVDQQYYTLQFQGMNIKLQIIDTAGNHRFRGITKTYYKGVAAAMIVYDVTQRATFREVQSWVQDCLLQCEPNTTLLLLGNKCDIAEKRQVSTEEGQEFARKNNMRFFETSAHNHKDILRVINEIVEHVYHTLMTGKTQLSQMTGIRDKSMEPGITLEHEIEAEDVQSD
ncbi:hypothetical protein ACHWQZ_G008407 [Mnemiopsis leidyi]